MLEQRFTNLTRRIQMMDSNMLNMRKRFDREIKAIDSDILDVKRDINGIKDKIELIIRELKGTPSKTDLAVLRKYIDMWNPLQFVTRSEVEKIVDRIIESKKKR